MIDKPIFLCGMMGAGKSTIGPLLASLTSKVFADLDQIIEDHEQTDIPSIFETKGEAYFRKCEREQLILSTQNFTGVLALGGGSLQNQQLTDIVKQSGWLIYLQPGLNQLVDRLADSKNRPMLTNHEDSGIRDRILSLSEERAPFYEQAHFTIKTGTLPPADLAEQILNNILSYEA